LFSLSPNKSTYNSFIVNGLNVVIFSIGSLGLYTTFGFDDLNPIVNKFILCSLKG